MRNAARITLLALAGAVACAAQPYHAVSGWCEQGNGTINVNGNPNAPSFKVQKSYPQCSVTVYQTGTTTKVATYSNSTGTVLANPFTSTTAGLWIFYVQAGIYDVNFSGAGIGAPFTISAYRVTGDVYLTDFGATTSSSDNSAAFASAIAALPANGGTIQIPCGDFKGKFTFPQYPKQIIMEGSGHCTILEEPTANSGIVASSAIVANYGSSRNILRNLSLKPHNSSTTSKAVDMRGQNDALYQNLWFEPATNGTGHFGWGFYCSTATVNYAACYGNTVDQVWAFIQVGPTILVETNDNAAVNTFSRFHVVDLTATTDIFYLNSPNNKIVSSDIEGNPLATVLHNGGGFNRVEGPTDWEGNNREILGDSNGYQLVVEGGSIGPGTTSTVTCSSSQSGWDFRNVSGITLASQLVGCVNAKVSVGSSIDGLAPKSIVGGLSTNTVTAATGASITEFPLGSGGLPADTYTYNTTVTTAGGASLPVTFGPITIANHSGLQLFFSGNSTVPYYTIYGRKCPTPATCETIITVPPEGNAGGGLWFDDGTLTPSGSSPTLTRPSTGDLNVNGNVGGDGGTASYIYTSGPINWGLENGADYLLQWYAQNGPKFTFQASPEAAGFPVCMYTTHDLRAGANTVALYDSFGNIFAGPYAIKKGTDFSANLTTAILKNNVVCLAYNAVKNVMQYQGQ